MNANEANNTLTDGNMVPLSEQPVRILTTDKDFNSQDYTELSDFMSIFYETQISQMSCDYRLEKSVDCPINEISIVNDIIQNTIARSKNGINLIPDFDSIPSDIKRKLKKGTYKIAESRQVSGNMRSVIVDEKGVRVKDITLKKVSSNSEMHMATKCVLSQLQMKQINDNLNVIIEIQNYQIERARDNAVLTPFFSARDYISRAQDADSFDKRNEYLEISAKFLTTALNAVCREMSTNIRTLAQKSKSTIFKSKTTIKTIIRQMSDDLQLYTKMSGLIMLVYEYLGQTKNSQNEFIKYKSFMKELLSSEVEDTGLSAIELMHDNFKYNKYNRNCWYDFSIKVKETLIEMDNSNKQDTYIVTLEDDKNE